MSCRACPGVVVHTVLTLARYQSCCHPFRNLVTEPTELLLSCHVRRLFLIPVFTCNVTVRVTTSIVKCISRRGYVMICINLIPLVHPASCKMGTGSFPGVKCGLGMLLTTHRLLVPRSWKSRAILPPSGPHLTCNGIPLPLPFYTAGGIDASAGLRNTESCRFICCS